MKAPGGVSWLLALFVLVAFGVSAADTEGGHLVLNGGGSKPAAVMEKFIELAGGREASIVVFPTASGEKDTGRYYRRLFEKDYGCTRVSIAQVRTRRDAQRDRIVDLVAHAGGIFFSGGDQRRITQALRGTPVGVAISKAFDRGAVVGGTSAGTACMSELMITGDGDLTVIEAGNVELWPGLGLLQGAILDQHFIARQRQNRLISVVLEHPDMLGIGVDEGTAVWVKPDRTFEVVGDGWVMVVDAVNADSVERRVGDRPRSLGASGIAVHVLLPGDAFDLERRTVVAR